MSVLRHLSGRKAASRHSRGLVGCAPSTSPTRVADEFHLEYLLGIARDAADAGDLKLVVTHLSQAVYVASTKRTSLDDMELFRTVKRVIDAAGGVRA